MRKTLAIFILTTLIAPIVACQATPVTPTEELIRSSFIAEARLSTKAQTAINEGRSQEALKSFENEFRKSVILTDETLLNYAQLLRNEGNPRTAIKIIEKYALDNKGKIRRNFSPVLLNELAANKIENGEFIAASVILNEVLRNKRLKELHPDAHNLVGIALDAKGRHSQAEVNFRIALNTWRGNTTSVKNNLAVCLASQGKFDEALMHLRQALIEAPNKEEISKNIELINSIRESIIPKPSRS